MKRRFSKTFSQESDTNEISRCGNCHAFLRPEDKYCRYCGTEKGKGDFRPSENMMACLYGPFSKGSYKCRDCGYSWESEFLGGNRTHYCPICGKEKLTILIERLPYTEQILQELVLASPEEEEADTLKAISLAAKTLETASSNSDKVLIVMDSGLATTEKYS